MTRTFTCFSSRGGINGSDSVKGSVQRAVAGSEAAFPTPCLDAIPCPVVASVVCTHESAHRTAKSLGLGGVPRDSQPTGPALPRPTRWRAESSLPCHAGCAAATQSQSTRSTLTRPRDEPEGLRWDRRLHIIVCWSRWSREIRAAIFLYRAARSW